MALLPDQSLSVGLAKAVQDVAFVLDQLSVTDCPRVTDAEAALILIVGIGGGVLEPPPHAIKSKHKNNTGGWQNREVARMRHSQRGRKSSRRYQWD